MRLGKLQGRASLDPSFVVPALLDALADRDAGVRAIATTYLGITKMRTAVPALTEMLKDEIPVPPPRRRRSFGAAANPALPAFVAPKATRTKTSPAKGSTIVKLQSR